MYFASDFVLAKHKIRSSEQESIESNEPDTNIVSMKFNQLIETNYAHAGDAIKCFNCEAILSKISKISEEKLVDEKRLWTCEFCNFENRIFIDNNEIPKSHEVSYILEPAAEKSTDSVDSSYLIYCIDISGSMSVTTEVKIEFS